MMMHCWRLGLLIGYARDMTMIKLMIVETMVFIGFEREQVEQRCGGDCRDGMIPSPEA